MRPSETLLWRNEKGAAAKTKRAAIRPVARPAVFRRPFSLLHIETAANPAQAVALMAITARITYNSARAGTG
jgi:hypothetical protein